MTPDTAGSALVWTRILDHVLDFGLALVVPIALALGFALGWLLRDRTRHR